MLPTCYCKSDDTCVLEFRFILRSFVCMQMHVGSCYFNRLYVSSIQIFYVLYQPASACRCHVNVVLACSTYVGQPLTWNLHANTFRVVAFCLHAKCMLICFSLDLDAKPYVALQYRLHGTCMLLQGSHKLCMLRSMEGGVLSFA